MKSSWVYVFMARYLIFVMAIMAVGFLSLRAAGWFQSGQIIIITSFASWLISAVLQYLIRRPRPYVKGPKAMIDMWVETPSFPSSHASISFAIAAMILWFDLSGGILFISLAMMIAVARVLVRVHYWTDILAGAILGSGVGLFLAYIIQNYI